MRLAFDLGEVVGATDAPWSVSVSADAQEVLEQNADVVIHSTSSSLAKVMDQLLMCLKAESSVVSTCEELSYPFRTHPELAATLDSAAKESGVALVGTGVNPGFVMDKLVVTLAAVSPPGETGPLIRHLRQSGQLTAGLILRALLSGNIEFFEQALAELSDLPFGRVSALVHDRRGTSFRALYERAGLPVSAYLAFREAIEAMREGGFVEDIGGATRLRRRMVERVLTRCADEAIVDIEPLLMLLRRFIAEAAREEARMFCQELAGEGELEAPYELERVAA